VSGTGTAAAGTAGSWLAVPTDRPRRPGTAARCGARTSLPRRAFGDAADDLVLAGFAATLFRYGGPSPLHIDHAGERVGYLVDGASTLAAVARTATRATGTGTGTDRADGDGGLRLHVGPDDVELHYDPALFDEDTADRMLDHVATLVGDAGRTPDRPVGLLRLLPDHAAHRMLVEWNRTQTPLAYEDCLHHAFEAQVGRTPHAVAVVHEGRRWTYEQVNAAANRLARHLVGLGVGPDVGVGLCLDRSPGLLVSMLGALKAGGAYVPLDPGYPPERLAAMVRGGRCAVLVSRTDLAERLPATALPVVLLDRDEGTLAALPGTDLGPRSAPGDLCYVMHTSGSTGVPKPIAVRHRGVLNNVLDLNARCAVRPGDSVLALSSPSFDMSVYEFLGVTLAGATLVVPDRARGTDPDHWAELLTAERVTLWNSAPPLLGLLLDHLERASCPPRLALRVVVLGGDWAPVTMPDRVRALARGARVVVCGGNTEASIHSTCWEVGVVDPDRASIPYGRPMANQRTYILDEALQPVPPGVAGELCLAGVGLAREYLDLPEATADRFVEWSYGDVTDRIYRTGDLARFRPDGVIELLGRMDFQLKINGIRVDLGEIEAVLRRHLGVREAAVMAHDGRLVGYVVPQDPAPTDDDLRRLAARYLPTALLPSAIVRLEALPLTPNGKLDRGGLPAPQVTAGPFREAGSATERVLAEVFADVLDLPRVGLDDDFFALGGDSIRAILVASRARARGIGVASSRILQLRTVAAVAASTCPTGPPAAVPAPAGPLVTLDEADRAELEDRYPGLAEVWPVTALQAGMLFESLLDESAAGAYLVQAVYHLSGPVDGSLLRAAGRLLLERHSNLRVAFAYDVEDGPVQVVVDGLDLPWQEVDLGHLPADRQEEAVERFLADDAAVRIDPAAPPLLRMALVRLGPERARLVLTVHHLLIDGWSEQVLGRDLVQLAAGRAPQPARPYRDFLEWWVRRDRDAALRAWQKELDGVTGPTTLAPPGTPRTRSGDVAEVRLPLVPGELAPAAGLGVTASTVVRGAWAAVLAELTGRPEVLFGATVAGRPGELDGVESMVGLFINTVPVRVQVDGDLPVDGYLSAVQRTQDRMADHVHQGLTELHQVLGVDALFDTLVVVQSFPPVAGGAAGGSPLEVTRVESRARSTYPLVLVVDAEALTLQYDGARFAREQAEGTLARFRSVAGQLARGGTHRLASAVEERPAPSREQALCGLFAEVLGVETVRADDNLFRLGCNSLTATRIIGRLRRDLGLEASISMIFQHPTAGELATLVTPAKARPSLRRATPVA